MSNCGMNVLYDGLDNEGVFALDAYIAQTPDDPIMITAGGRHNEGLAKARQIKRDYPSKTVLYRRYPDDHQHQRIPNTNDWLNLYAPLSEGGIFVCDMNESGIGDLDKQSEWMATNIENLCKRGGHLAFWHINTHNPPRHMLPQLRPAFEAAAQYPKQTLACQHHYFDVWNDDAYRYLVDAQDYCASIGIRLDWAITELGYAHQIDPYIGFQHHLSRKEGVSDEYYAAALVAQLTRLATRRTIAFVYSFGDPAPWWDFDVRRTLVLPRLISYNVSIPPMTQIQWQAARLKPNGNYTVNVRASANGTIIGVVPAEGLDADVDKATLTADWLHIRYFDLSKARTIEGYASRQFLTVSEVSTQPEPPPTIPEMTVEEAETWVLVLKNLEITAGQVITVLQNAQTALKAVIERARSDQAA